MLHLPVLLGLSSLLTLAIFPFSKQQIFEDLSPQGCSMSWMSPSYVHQSAFDTSWTPLALRYSLYLYREIEWDNNEVQGAPVLFIPGNAGSFRQVRSIASSASRQFYSSPSTIARDFRARQVKPLDFFSVDFNEDLSAFHGPTLEAQIHYVSHAVSYILSLYPTNTSIIVLGHSMGGIVATALLARGNISVIITMSTPHALPPSRTDVHMDKIYRDNKRLLDFDSTPILSICGGATDMMIPSETCILSPGVSEDIFRRTVFTSALEGVWTGVGHREIVWCHQVRWRVARAALEMTAVISSSAKADVLDAWLGDGQSNSAGMIRDETVTGPRSEVSAYHVLEEGEPVILYRPQNSSLNLVPIPLSKSTVPLTAVVHVALGSFVPSLSHSSYPLRVSVFLCSKSADTDGDCRALQPSLLKVIPNPRARTLFPLPDEGAKESDGTSVFEADIPPIKPEIQLQRFLGVRVEHGDGRGWVYGHLSFDDDVIVPVSMTSLLFGGVNVNFPYPNGRRARFVFPNAPSSALVVYRFTPLPPEKLDWCSDALLPPIIMHASQPTETHYYPIHARGRRILLHTHRSAPYISSTAASYAPLDFTIYSSGSIGCNMPGFSLGVDWPATLGRWAPRYLTALITWSVGIVSVIICSNFDRGGAVPTVTLALGIYIRHMLAKSLIVAISVAFLPIPAILYLGTGGQISFAPIAPFLLLMATGLVCLSWILLEGLLSLTGAIQAIIRRNRISRESQESSIQRTVNFMAVVCLSVYFFIPWQVIYFGCWISYLWTCANARRQIYHLNLEACSDRRVASTRIKLNDYNCATHLLLFMTWLLPFIAPVLIIWMRMLWARGLFASFESDNNFLNVVPFLILVNLSSRNIGKLFEPRECETVFSIRWCWALMATFSIVIGPLRAYAACDAAKVVFGLLLIRTCRRGPVSFTY